MKKLTLITGLFLCLWAVFNSSLASTFITVASTTSTANSGLFAHLLPKFSEETGIEVRVIAVGTGQAIRIARKGDADVLFVHHRASEDKFVADGFGEQRYDVMYNDFVIVGPHHDPAEIRNCPSPVDALRRIHKQQSIFVSRGDDSGTHKRELAIWKAAGVSAKDIGATWYRSTGSGMGSTLNIASAMNGYALSDRGTWIAFKNKGNLDVLCEKNDILKNPYGIVAVSKTRFPHAKSVEANRFINWLRSAKGQQLIASYKINGQQLFTPNAR